MSKNPSTKASRRLSTIIARAGTPEDHETALSMPIYQTSTFRFLSAEHGADLSQEKAPTRLYTRWGNPTTKALEQALAEIESGEAALAFSSGMAAGVTAVMSQVKSGDHIVAANCLYTGMTELFNRILEPLGVTTTFVDPSLPGAYEEAIRDETRMLYAETPANPTLAITDLEEIAALGRSRGLFTIADNTWASPWNQRPLELGIDLVIHSATKYLGGHSDVISGAAVGSQEAIDQMWPYLKVFGGCPGPQDAWLVLRGLKTLAVRVERQNATTMEVARFLENHPRISEVYYPGLPNHPGHEIATRQMPGGYGGMLAFEVAGGVDAGKALLERLQVVTHAVSLGGVDTLAVHAASTTHAPLTPEERLLAGIPDGLVRMSVGLEDPADLIEDLEQGLRSLG